jgi:murein DD-endopeptidase MepM/ murein hydrolase activator NlpD
MHHRNQAVIISSFYLFVPMLFVPLAPLASEIPKMSVPPIAINEPGILDDFLGQGGPEEPGSKYIVSFFEGEKPPLEPVVTEVKIYNHMKVANTQWPVDTPTVSSAFGWRTPPCSKCSSDHKGVDFVPGAGTPVYAVADGMIVEMGQGGGYGDYVVITHLMGNADGGIDEWTTLYAHLKHNSFSEGLRIGSVVKAGDVLGLVGNTGVSTGPHLHFELLINGQHVDPMPLLGTYEIIIVTEEEHQDWMFLGETFRTVETVVIYE